jgi:hypothetical protein
MAGYPNTGSIIDGPNGVNRTTTALSTNIIIEVDGQSIGAIQSLQITETRTIRMVDEVGTDGHIDSAPNKSTDVKGTCERIRFNRLRIAEAFGRGYIHAKSQRVPFDIIIKDIFDNDNSSMIITTLKNVWIASIGYQYRAGDFLITENLGWEAETIYSTLGNTNSAAAQGGLRGLNLYKNPIEIAADIGGRRGALDAAGLVNAFFGSSTA